jgi:hypothetical protein
MARVVSCSYRFCCRPAAAVFVLLLLSGCIGKWSGGDWSLLRPEPVRYSAAGAQQPLLPRLPLEKELLLPIPPLTPEISPEQPREALAVPDRRLAAAGLPDFSYGEAVLTEDVTWRGEVLITGVVTVAPQATLTISPGTVVRFGRPAGPSGGGALLLVRGRLAAQGAPERPVLFTSRYAEPVPGDWQGLVLVGSEKKNLLENCRLEGADTGLDASFSTVSLINVFFSRCTTGARLHDTVLFVSKGGVSDCTEGMVLADSEADLRDPVFAGNRRGLVADRSSLYLMGGAFTGNGSEGLRAANSRVKISGSAFSANGTGLSLVSSQGSVSGCRIADNDNYGIAITSSRVKINDNEIVKNGTAGLKVDDGMGAAWGNSFAATRKYDLFNAGSEDFRAMANWWGGVPLSEIGKRIYDRQANSKCGRVLYFPPLAAKPVPIH